MSTEIRVPEMGLVGLVGVSQPVFAVLALESEPVDPRLCAEPGQSGNRMIT